MSYPIKLELIDDTQATELGVFDLDSVDLGREPPAGGVTLNSAAVSRLHGQLKRYANHWLYLDCGSTNGSWVNGVRVSPNQYKIVRSGEILQLGDLGVQVTAVGKLPKQNRSILVFSGEVPVSEFEVRDYGRALTVGGSEADLVIPADLRDAPALFVERQGAKVVAVQAAQDLPIFYNGKRLEGQVELSHNDTIKIGPFSLLYQEGSQEAGSVTDWLQENPELSAGVVRRSAPGKAQFGQLPSPEDDAVDEDQPSDTSIVRRAASVGTTAARTPPTYVFQAVEDRIVLFFGFLMVLAVLLAVVWWLVK